MLLKDKTETVKEGSGVKKKAPERNRDFDQCAM